MKIAIIGTGISGNVAAWLLQPQHAITVYEKNSYPGGHARTLEVDYDGRKIAVDTGFIVFNHRCYPQLTGLFEHLGVETQPSDMSFAVSIRNGWLEYGTKNLASLFGQRRNLLRPDYWRMLKDILRFFDAAKHLLEIGDIRMTLGDFIRRQGFGDWFRDYYLLPMGGAIWSCPVRQMLEFPAYSFLRFFDNHGLLSVNDQPQWWTVTGGSRTYVEKLIAPFRDRIRLQCGVVSITRSNGRVEILDTDGRRETYDHAILACHADEALAMLFSPTAEERNLLSAFTYQKNIAYLHRDASFMPKRRACWSSWVYLSGAGADRRDMSLTYWMNHLQTLPEDCPLFVTLNPERKPHPNSVFDLHEFSHPVFTVEAVAAQRELHRIQGKNNLLFCGAYTRYGFHEDGIMSGIEAAKRLGASVPWQKE